MSGLSLLHLPSVNTCRLTAPMPCVAAFPSRGHSASAVGQLCELPRLACTSHVLHASLPRLRLQSYSCHLCLQHGQACVPGCHSFHFMSLSMGACSVAKGQPLDEIAVCMAPDTGTPADQQRVNMGRLVRRFTKVVQVSRALQAAPAVCGCAASREGAGGGGFV